MFYLLVSCLIFGSSYAKIPEAGCNLTDSNLDTCLRDYVSNLISLMSSGGIPEVHFQHLDPLTIPKLVIQPNSSQITGVLLLRDLKVKGLAKTEILSVDSDLDKHVNETLEMNILNPKLMITGKYNGSLNVGAFPIYGDGELTLELREVSTTAMVLAEDDKRDGKEYLTVKDVDVNVVLGGLKVNATNLLHDDDILVSYARELLNNHWREYYDQVFSQVKPHLEAFFTDMISNYTTIVPKDKIVWS